MWVHDSEVVVTVASFAATNIDNLLLLVTLMAASPPTRVAVAYALSATLVLAFAGVGSLLGALVDPAALGYLGLLPLGLGLAKGYTALRQGPAIPVEPSDNSQVHPATTGANSFSALLLLMLSNSGDTLAMFIPLFADAAPAVATLLAGVFALMVALWLMLAIVLMRQPVLTAWIGRQERWLLPSLLITIGVFILMDTDYDRLF